MAMPTYQPKSWAETLLEMGHGDMLRPQQVNRLSDVYALRQEGIRTGGAEWALQQQKEAWELQKQSAQNTANLTQQFLSQWGVGMEKLGNLYDKILSGETGGAAGPLGELTDKIMQEYEDFKTEYQPMEREFFEAAREELGIRRDLAGQLQRLATPDYEGVAGTAMADVAGQSEMARQAAAREAMGYGIDPTSGKFGALTRKSYLDEARNRAIAANLARRGEKERVSGLTTEALGLIKPSETAGVGLGIQKGRTGLLTTAGELGKARADIQRSYADIVGNYGEQMVQPYGEVGFTLLGHQLGQGGGVPATGITPAATTGTTQEQAIPTRGLQRTGGYATSRMRNAFKNY